MSSDHKKEVCTACGKDIKDKLLRVNGGVYHPECYKCGACDKQLAGLPAQPHEGKFFCTECFKSLHAPNCGLCQQPIEGKYISALNQCWCPEHFVCTICEEPFTDGSFQNHENKPYCKEHFFQITAGNCAKCGEVLADGKDLVALGKRYHINCWTCECGGHVIPHDAPFHVVDETKIYCHDHYVELFVTKCVGCNEQINGAYLRVNDQPWHSECLKCSSCQTPLADKEILLKDKKLICGACNSGTVPKRPNKFAPSEAKHAPAASKPAAAPANKSAPAAAPAAAQSVKIQKEFLAYKALQRKTAAGLPSWVDVTKKETYLSPEIFQQVFEMTRDKFYALPKWKRVYLKKQKMLF